MDLYVALIGIGVFIVSAAILLLVAVFGIKEKSYEEAVAEQRQQTNALLGINNKPKAKEVKKQKKAHKKVKEKKAATVGKDSTEEETESTSDHGSPVHNKNHVEFKEEINVIVVDTEKEVKEAVPHPAKKRNKKEKVRPILVHNKVDPADAVVADDTATVVAANHFEQLHPKDDLELLHLHIKEESKVEPVKEQIKEQPIKERKNKLEKKKPLNNDIPITIAATVADTSPVTLEEQQGLQPQGSVNLPNIILKKKKKSENSNMHIIADKQGVMDVSSLLSLVRKAELTRSEVQILIDLLLNKQHEAPTTIDEWTEGKADPVQKLKKQLADKEKALADEQEALVSAQSKLREVRQEQIAERMHLQQRNKATEETLKMQVAESQALSTRVLGLNEKLSQMQTQLNSEVMKLRQVVEENNVLQLRVGQMANTQELEMVHMQLEKEFRDLQDMHANLTHHNQLMHNQIGAVKSESDQKDDLIRQLKEQITDWEHRMQSIHRQETEISQLKSTCQQQLEEIRRLEQGKTQFQKQKDESEIFIAQLKMDLEKSAEEKAKLETAKQNGSAEESKLHQIELLNLHNELSSVKLLLQQSEIRFAEELDLTVEGLRRELQEQKVKNNELRQKNWKVMDALTAAENRNKTAPVANGITQDHLSNEIQKAHDLEQESQREFILRLFPDIDVDDDVYQDEWCDSVEKAISEYISKLKTVAPSVENSEVPKLKAEIKRYLSVINESENILTTLQTHVEQEELNWRRKIAEKEQEIAHLKNNNNQQMNLQTPTSPTGEGVNFAFKCIEKSLPTIVDEAQQQLSSLQQQLEEALQSQSQLRDECKLLKSNQSLAAVEQLAEKVNRLEEQLELEKKKNIELVKTQHETISNNAIKAQNHTATNGTTNNSTEPSLTTSSSAASSVAEVALKPKNKKKKKKNQRVA